MLNASFSLFSLKAIVAASKEVSVSIFLNVYLLPAFILKVRLTLFEFKTSADAVLILCDWENYKVLNWKKISKEMRQPAWIFDTRDVVDEAQVSLTNLNLWKLGQGTKNIQSLF